MKVEAAVEILTNSSPSRYQFEREFAVATFCGWLNSPAEPADQASTVFIAFNRAVLHARKHNYDPPINWLLEFYDAAAYLDSTTVLVNEPLCWALSEDTTYSDCRYAADVVRFMLTFRPKSDDKRKRASLGKAWEFINKNGGFNGGKFGSGRSEWCSNSHHQVIWRRQKRAAALHCARFHGRQFDWYLDPRQPNFLEKLTSTAAQTDDIIDFFSKAHDLQEQLKAVIDQRSMNTEDFFPFPDTLELCPIM